MAGNINFSWTTSISEYRGTDAVDINLDGKIDFVGGGGWFEHTGGGNFTFHSIDGAMGYSQIKAGQLIPGGRPEVVCVLELSAGPLNMYEWTGSEWQTHNLLSNVVSGDKDTGVVPVANVWYLFRIEVEDTGTQTEIRAKVWAEGESEPVDWQAEAFDATPTRLTEGTIGLWSMGPGNKYWDDIAVVSFLP